MTEITQIIVVLFGTSGLIYIIIKEWLAWARRKNESKLKETEFDSKLRRDSTEFIIQFGKDKISDLEKSYDELLLQFREFRKDFDILNEKYAKAITRIDELEKANTRLKKELDECIGVVESKP